MRGRLRQGALAGGLGLVAWVTLGAAGATAEELRAGGSAGPGCATEPAAEGGPGVAKRAWTAPAEGLLTVRLAGGETPDWDLAVFRSGGALVRASTSATSNELVTLPVRPGDRLAIQACRLGATPSVPLRLDFARLDLPRRPKHRVSLESVSIGGRGDLERLHRLGIDVTENVSPGAATVVLYSNAERARLASAGFPTLTVVADLAAHDAAERAAERAAAQGGGRSNLPSGRDTYRVYSDYTSELKALADQNPTLARSIVLGQTVEGRPIEGVEIATDVNRTDDGRPVYLNFGAHHAREWPSAEFPMEFAIDLVERFNAGDPRVATLLGAVRVVIVPVVNADGFIVSRETVAGENRRKNCRPTLGDAAVPCAMRATNSGVDLNRNYGAYWGGPGSSGSASSESYRGPAPYSEPEAEAVHQFTSRIHPTVFITNHTFTNNGAWLRQPGFNASFLPQDAMGSSTPDEAAMKSLGDAMAGATGWDSERAHVLGDITGATEDWNYFAQGTYGYTPEARGVGFHDAYPDAVVQEYLGDAQHPGLGVREAFLLAGEVAADHAHHGVVAGSGRTGGELGLRKEFATETSQPGLAVDDVLDTRLTVPAGGTYEWHVNPSGRPLVPGETWTMTCTAPGGVHGSAQVAVGRGQRVIVDWSDGCAASGDVATGRCAGKRATIVGSRAADTLRGTSRRDVIAAKGGKDRIGARGRNDVVCGGGGKDRLKGGGGNDKLRGGGGRDTIRGGGGRDRIQGGGGRDRCLGGGGRDKISGCR